MSYELFFLDALALCTIGKQSFNPSNQPSYNPDFHYPACESTLSPSQLQRPQIYSVSVAAFRTYFDVSVTLSGYAWVHCAAFPQGSAQLSTQDIIRVGSAVWSVRASTSALVSHKRSDVRLRGRVRPLPPAASGSAGVVPGSSGGTSFSFIASAGSKSARSVVVRQWDVVDSPLVYSRQSLPET